MENVSHNLHHAKHALEALEKAGPLHKEKSAALAAVLGFFFGAVGIAIYFRSWTDFWLCLILGILFFTLIPVAGIVVAGIFCAVYGYYRANSSNEKLRKQTV